MRRMNDHSRAHQWWRNSSEIIARTMKNRGKGHVFLATREVGTELWQDHAFKTEDLKGATLKHFRKYSRQNYDHYFCVNVFRAPVRKKVNALPSCCAWVDIDDADPNAFDPPPNILIRTSPGRFQGIRLFKDTITRRKAEQYSKDLAYNFSADKNGWSATKYLRVPYTFNHKPEYDRPLVKVLRFSLTPQVRKPLPNSGRIRRSSGHTVFQTDMKDTEDWQRIYRKYRKKLHVRVRSLIDTKRAYVFEKDRSKCIYEIVVSMAEAGASLGEIASVLWHNPYFICKHGQNRDRLDQELSRILSKIGGAS